MGPSGKARVQAARSGLPYFKVWGVGLGGAASTTTILSSPGTPRAWNAYSPVGTRVDALPSVTLPFQ
jgi:hypothetical protein